MMYIMVMSLVVICFINFFKNRFSERNRLYSAGWVGWLYSMTVEPTNNWLVTPLYNSFIYSLYGPTAELMGDLVLKPGQLEFWLLVGVAVALISLWGTVEGVPNFLAGADRLSEEDLIYVINVIWAVAILGWFGERYDLIFLHGECWNFEMFVQTPFGRLGVSPYLQEQYAYSKGVRVGRVKLSSKSMMNPEMLDLYRAVAHRLAPNDSERLMKFFLDTAEKGQRSQYLDRIMSHSLWFSFADHFAILERDRSKLGGRGIQDDVIRGLYPFVDNISAQYPLRVGISFEFDLSKFYNIYQLPAPRPLFMPHPDLAATIKFIFSEDTPERRAEFWKFISKFLDGRPPI